MKTTSLIRSSEIAVRRLRRLMDNLAMYPRHDARDVVILGLMRHAFQVQKSVLILCRASAGSEAYALSRIIVESFLALRWITNDDAENRAKQYGFFGFKQKQYWAGVIPKYYAEREELKEAVAKQQAIIERYSKQYKYFSFWANLDSKLKGMAAEKEKLEPSPPGPSDALWDYRFPYSMTSDHVHATIVAIDDLLPDPGRPFQVGLSTRKGHIDNALWTATSYLFRMALRIDFVFGLGVEVEIGKIFEPFKQRFPIPPPLRTKAQKAK